jgi:hypothetical protein
MVEKSAIKYIVNPFGVLFNFIFCFLSGFHPELLILSPDGALKEL